MNSEQIEKLESRITQLEKESQRQNFYIWIAILVLGYALGVHMYFTLVLSVMAMSLYSLYKFIRNESKPTPAAIGEFTKKQTAKELENNKLSKENKHSKETI